MAPGYHSDYWRNAGLTRGKNPIKPRLGVSVRGLGSAIETPNTSEPPAWRWIPPCIGDLRPSWRARSCSARKQGAAYFFHVMRMNDAIQGEREGKL